MPGTILAVSVSTTTGTVLMPVKKRRGIKKMVASYQNGCQKIFHYRNNEAFGK
jgi:hypothetical protein